MASSAERVSLLTLFDDEDETSPGRRRKRRLTRSTVDANLRLRIGELFRGDHFAATAREVLRVCVRYGDAREILAREEVSGELDVGLRTAFTSIAQNAQTELQTVYRTVAPAVLPDDD